MLTILLLVINVCVTGFGIYLFDYRVDELVNSPVVIILSLVSGTIIMLGITSLNIEVFYQLVAKRMPIDSKLKHFLANQLLAIPLHATNTRIKVIGRENLPEDPGFSIYVNHTSLWDIPLLMYKLNDYPIAFLEKEVVVNLFSVGKWTPALGCVTIDRDNDRKGAESIINVIKNVKNGSSMVIFPEGTRGKENGILLEFKPGSFKVALKSKAPLVPMSIVKPKKYNKTIWPMPRRVTLVIHKPLEYEEFKMMKTVELSEKVESIIKGPLNTIYND